MSAQGQCPFCVCVCVCLCLLRYLSGTLHSDLKCCYRLRDFLQGKASDHEITQEAVTLPLLSSMCKEFLLVRTPTPPHPPSNILPIHLDPQSCITIKVMKQSLRVHVAAIQRAYSAPLMPPGTSFEFRKEAINLSVQLHVQQQ